MAFFCARSFWATGDGFFLADRLTGILLLGDFFAFVCIKGIISLVLVVLGIRGGP